MLFPRSLAYVEPTATGKLKCKSHMLCVQIKWKNGWEKFSPENERLRKLENGKARAIVTNLKST